MASRAFAGTFLSHSLWKDFRVPDLAGYVAKGISANLFRTCYVVWKLLSPYHASARISRAHLYMKSGTRTPLLLEPFAHTGSSRHSSGPSCRLNCTRRGKECQRESRSHSN